MEFIEHRTFDSCNIPNIRYVEKSILMWWHLDRRKRCAKINKQWQLWQYCPSNGVQCTMFIYSCTLRGGLTEKRLPKNKQSHNNNHFIEKIIILNKAVRFIDGSVCCLFEQCYFVVDFIQYFSIIQFFCFWFSCFIM